MGRLADTNDFAAVTMAVSHRGSVLGRRLRYVGAIGWSSPGKIQILPGHGWLDALAVASTFAILSHPTGKLVWRCCRLG